ICLALRGFELKTFLYLAVLAFVSFCYSLPFSNLGLRGIPFLKLFLIAFVWAGSSIGLLLVVHHSLIQYVYLFLAVMLFVIGITIPFDIRDKITDESELKTIPQSIGLNSSKIVSVFCLMLSGLLFYFEFKFITFGLLFFILGRKLLIASADFLWFVSVLMRFLLNFHQLYFQPVCISEKNTAKVSVMLIQTAKRFQKKNRRNISNHWS